VCTLLCLTGKRYSITAVKLPSDSDYDDNDSEIRTVWWYYAIHSIFE